MRFVPQRILGCLAVSQSLLAGDLAVAASFLQKFATDPEVASLRFFIEVLQAIVGGSRDRSLADAPDLNYSMAAEILFLLDKLEKAGK